MIIKTHIAYVFVGCLDIICSIILIFFILYNLLKNLKYILIFYPNNLYLYST